MSNRFQASIAPSDLKPSQSWWFILSGYRLLTKPGEETLSVPQAANPEELEVSVSHHVYIGTVKGVPCYAAEMDAESKSPAGLAFEELRLLFDRLEDGLFEAALTAVHILEWEKNSRYCGRCCGNLKPLTTERAMKCERCGRLEFPRISPAIIVLIEKGDTLLLARSGRFAAPFFSVLAGFVEPGESLEEAVHREVMEETGIAVKNVRYFGSQPWPFPDSLMIGFTAQYESGEIKIDGEEIVEAGWYGINALPRIPGKVSIARQLIDWFIAKHP